jgi:glycosyltransferase involved in cell wall biosynthesis
VTRRILILSGTQLSANPRVVKEADTLSDAGYGVEVVGGLFQPEMADRERPLYESKRWTYTSLVDAKSHSRRERLKWLRLRIRRRVWREIHGRLGIANPRELGYLAPEMLAYALESHSDLTIVHNPASTWVGDQLIKHGRSVAVDMEDWYSEDLTPEERIHFPAGALRQYEREALRGAVFSMTTSRSMSQALSAAYGCEPPRVVYNSFPLEYRDSIDGQRRDRVNPALPSVCWFSQVVGPLRGLETLIEALPTVEMPCEVHLRGTTSAEYCEQLLRPLSEEWRNRIYFHPQVPHAELISRIAEHDIGLATEVPHSASRRLTITNKLPLYLLAGLPVVASDTDGQREAADLAPGAVFLFGAGKASELADQLNRLLSDPALRATATENAITATREVFSWERSAGVLLSEVERVFSGKQQPHQALAPSLP